MAVYAQGDLAAGIGRLYATRSPDEGLPGPPPVLAGSQPIQMFVDPETGNEYPQPGFPSAADAPDGTVYVANEHDTSVASGAITVARSRDGGRTWTSSEVTGVSAFAFFPSVAVDSHGTVGVTWYDLRNDRPGDAALTADAWFASSDDRAAPGGQGTSRGPSTCEPRRSAATATNSANTKDLRRCQAAASRRYSRRQRRWPRTVRRTTSRPDRAGLTSRGSPCR